MISPQDILKFWFEELTMKDWYVQNPELDQRIHTDFGQLHHAATQGELYPWRHTTDGRLAEVIILDQFSRNIFRNQPSAFAFDGMALVLAQDMVTRNLLKGMPEIHQHHVLLPHMHSESSIVHQQAVELRTQYGLDLEYEIKHKIIIDRFGRYPHRNEILGRASTPEELDFLKQPGSSF